MSSTAPTAAKPVPVTLELSVSYSSKGSYSPREAMSIEQFTEEVNRAKNLATEARKLGTVEGTVKIGSQKFKL